MTYHFRMPHKFRLLAMVVLFPAGLALCQDWVDVFTATNMDGIEGVGSSKYNNAKPKLELVGGVLTGSGGCCSYFQTVKSYSQYKTRIEFQGTGNSGFTWHLDKWDNNQRGPDGVEININNGNTKEIWWWNVDFKSYGTSAGYKEGGAVINSVTGGNAYASFASTVNAQIAGFNVFEITVDKGKMDAILNGKLWMQVFELKSKSGASLASGHLGFLIEENAKIQIKTWKIQDLSGGTSLRSAPKAAPADGRARLRLNPVGDGLEIVRQAQVFNLKGSLIPGR